jgi:hypothetical protein
VSYLRGVSMVDYRRFKTYVVNTGVWKGYDYIILPDGSRVGVEPGKYLKLFSEEPLVFGFEDLTEELGERPDWDFDEPKCEVVDESGFIMKTVRLKCTYTAGYENHLYFNNTLVAVFERGSYTKEVEFDYIDWAPIIMIGLGVLLILVSRYR